MFGTPPRETGEGGVVRAVLSPWLAVLAESPISGGVGPPNGPEMVAAP